MTSEEIAALFSRRKVAFADRDSRRLAADCAENCVLESPTFGRVIGRDAAEKVYRHFFVAFPDLTLSPGDLLIVGNQVIQTSTVQGTDTGGFLGQEPTGRPFRFFFVQFFRLANDQIVHERRVFDVNGLILQLASDSGLSTETAQIYSAALQRARVEQELKIAAEIQQALLPSGHYQKTHLEIAARSLPCRAIGGDFFDYFDAPNGAVCFALGDVAGKGPPAALLAAEMQGILAAYSSFSSTVAETVARVNQLLNRRIVESRFVTMLYGMGSRDGRLTYSNAGHNPPLLITGRGARWLDKGGVVLGMFAAAQFEQEQVDLEPGDVVVMYSDGVTEALDREGSEFGEERLLSCVSENRDAASGVILDSLLTTVRNFTVGAPQSDDLTVMIVRYGRTE